MSWVSCSESPSTADCCTCTVFTTGLTGGDGGGAGSPLGGVRVVPPGSTGAGGTSVPGFGTPGGGAVLAAPYAASVVLVIALAGSCAAAAPDAVTRTVAQPARRLTDIPWVIRLAQPRSTGDVCFPVTW
ncbi:hypothetical protein GCM10009765_01170 [Fodinicola feengrottensis]|uniref:Uncharacterized protein n=1 Tax=Fodinicola feengrottensis TaxID=435914 RepID=A0ABP4RPQ9_9ACTN